MCMRVRGPVHISAGVCAYCSCIVCLRGCEYVSGGRYFPITALPVPHCSGKLFATLHD